MADLKKFFKKTEPLLEEKTEQLTADVPKGLWVKCPKCGEAVYKEDVVSASYVCPKCGGYFRMKAGTRIRMIADTGSFREWEWRLEDTDPLEYPGYCEKRKQLREKTKLAEALRIGEASIGGHPVILGAMDSRFLMGSMGCAVGEQITRAFEEATEKRIPVILFCCSGGARMQEGILSLMQMAKTSAAISRHSKAGFLYIPVLTDPTTGGVTASFAMLGDVILAEAGALIGFAGPRVIAQTVGEKLPKGFQSAEFLLEHGMVDAVVSRENLRGMLLRLLEFHAQGGRYGSFPLETPARVAALQTPKRRRKERKIENTTAWERVLTARSPKRPTSFDYIEEIFQNFTELHGDRSFGDDGAMLGGIAHLDGQPVTVLGIQKGRTTKENVKRNFGMPSPEGYRKALRLMKQAEKFQRPIICFIDTPGAFCGIGAEERGQGEAIARNLMEMSALQVPVLSIVIGEGGSGGALALGVGNQVWMMENATYSILSPEGFASILWKDSKKASKASEVMKVTAADLRKLGVIERVIPEEQPAGRDNLAELSEYMKIRIKEFLRECEGKSGEQLARERYERFRRY